MSARGPRHRLQIPAWPPWVRPVLVAGLLVASEAVWPSVCGGLTADQVLIVVNEQSALSERIAEYYREARSIPRHHVVRVRTTSSDEIDRSAFVAEIERPIAVHLVRRSTPS